MGSNQTGELKASQAIVRWALILFLATPYVLLVLQVGRIHWEDWDELRWAFRNTLLQSFFSALFASVGGAFLALGWSKAKSLLPEKWVTVTQWLLIGPALLPPIFILLMGFSVLSPFPRGVLGIALVHGFMNLGLVAVVIEKSFFTKLNRLAQIAQVLGSSKFFFWRKAFPLIAMDIVYAFFFVFSFCLGAFSVPLIIGGNSGTTLEVLIYEKVRISGAWGEALFLAFFQWLILYLTLKIIDQRSFSLKSMRIGYQDKASALLGSRISLLFVLLLSFGFFIGYIYFSISGWPRVLAIEGLWQEALRRLVLTGVLIGFSFVLFYLFFKTLARLFYDKGLRKYFLSYLPPSAALVGFALLFYVNEQMMLIAFVFGVFWMFFPSVYRMGWVNAMDELEPQLQTARWLGSDNRLTFQMIVWPQMKKRALNLSLIGAVFVSGDFAFSKVFLNGDETLALLIEALMSSYRIEAAIALSSLLILLPLAISITIRSGVLYFDKSIKS